MTSTPSTASWLMLSLIYEDENGPQTALLTSNENGVDFQSSLFAFDEYLSVELPEWTAILDEDDGSVYISNKYSLCTDLVGGRAFSPVQVRLFELFDDGRILWLLEGRAEEGEMNPQGRPGQFRLRVRNPKEETNRHHGSIALESCVNEFGGAASGRGGTCMFDVVAAEEATEILSIDRKKVTVDALTAQPAGYWKHGSIRAAGVSISILDWDNSLTFTLAELPPVAWQELVTANGSLPADVRPGCAKNVQDCIRFGQENNWRGLGVDIPRYNPLFETGR